MMAGIIRRNPETKGKGMGLRLNESIIPHARNKQGMTRGKADFAGAQPFQFRNKCNQAFGIRLAERKPEPENPTAAATIMDAGGQRRGIRQGDSVNNQAGTDRLCNQICIQVPPARIPALA